MPARTGEQFLKERFRFHVAVHLHQARGKVIQHERIVVARGARRQEALAAELPIALGPGGREGSLADRRPRRRE